MKHIEMFLFRSSIDREKSAFFWNMVAGMLSAAESVVLSMIATRVCGLEEAGIITIAYAIANLMATIGKFGVRTYQVTDISQEHTFAAYYRVRQYTLALMFCVCLAYVWYCREVKSYSLFKCVVVLLVCFRFMIEIFEDVIAGECQRKGRLDIASKVFVMRSGSFLLLFTICILFSKSLLEALVIAILFVIGFECLLVKLVANMMEITVSCTPQRDVMDIVWDCLPLFLSTFFFFYVTNAPKYAIDSVMDDKTQACFSFIAFPVFAIELMNNFVYQPILVDIANDWINCNFLKVNAKIYKQLIFIFLLTGTVFVGGYFVGIPILSALFSTDLSSYKKELLGLLIGGGLLAVDGYLSTILITMRKNWEIIYGYIVVSLLSLFLYVPILKNYQIIGAVKLYCLLCFFLALYEYVIIEIIIKKEMNL